MDSFGIWTPSSVEILCLIACISTVWNGLSTGKAFRHLVEWLSVHLYCYNDKMVLHCWELHPLSEDDWLQGYSVEEDSCLEDLPQNVVERNDSRPCADMGEQSWVEVSSGFCRDNTVSDSNFPSTVSVTNRFHCSLLNMLLWTLKMQILMMLLLNIHTFSLLLHHLKELLRQSNLGQLI